MYLRGLVENVTDPLRWWNNNRHVYPTLYRMALDYLSIPGSSSFTCLRIWLRSDAATSTEVERVFSQGQQLLHFTRNRLSPSSIRAYMCLGSWSRHELLSMENLLSVLREKKRGRWAETNGEDQLQ